MRMLRRAAARLFTNVPDDAACDEIAQTARAFSRDAKAIVDDKLSFTATLMRAGEVEAANRLFAEVEHDVMSEAATLLERVEEVQRQQEKRRRRIQLQPAASMVLLVAGLFAFSAAGASVVSNLVGDSARKSVIARESASEAASRAAGRVAGDGRARGARPGRASARGAESNRARAAAARSRRVTVISLASDLQSFLMGLLPNGLADRVQEVMVAAQESRSQVPRAPDSVKGPGRGAPAPPAAPEVPAGQAPPQAPGLAHPTPPAPALEPSPSPEGLLTPVPNRPR